MGTAEKIVVNVSPVVRGELLPVLYGITQGAADKYRQRGQWQEGKHWKRDPANRIVYFTQEIEKWLSS